MSNPGQPPINLTTEKMQRLVEHIQSNFDAHDDDGNLDLEKCQNNVAYNIGHIYTNYNGLLLQERLKLADIKADLAIVRDKTYHDIKMKKAAYDIEAAGLKIKIDGSKEVATKQREYDKQEVYVKFLENVVRQVSSYATGVKTMLYREEIRYRYNQ